MKTLLAGSLWFAFILTAGAGLDNPVVESLAARESYARGGDPGEQFNLGMMYYSGQEVGKDPVKAFSYFKAAADRGLPNAEFFLSLCLLNGTGAAKDEKAAATWCLAAARQGVVQAQLYMVRNNVNGIGTKKDPVTALAWDFIARRTLFLRKGGDIGAPPVPGRVRADGAVEQTDSNGRKVWLMPDKGRVTADAGGVRVVEYPDGMRATITPDGVRETTMPEGDREWRLPDGTQILQNAAGATRATFPDGRLESKDGAGGMQVIFPDGAKTVEGPGSLTNGERVTVKESYDAAGKLQNKRIVENERTIVQQPDGTFTAEYAGQDAEGKPLTLVESYDAKGELLGRELVKPDGTKREGTEEWTIERRLRNPENPRERLRVRETYGLGGSSSKNEVLDREPVPAPIPMKPVAPRTGPIVFKVPPSPADRLNMSYAAGDASKAGPGDAETKAALATLQDFEASSRNFAGATEANYQAARAQAAQYLMAFDNPPQKSELNWMKFKTARLEPPQPRLQEVPTDLSKKYPFGVNGQEAIAMRAWKHAESDHFVVHFTDVASAAPVINYIENAYCVVVQLLQVEEARGAAKSHVFVFPDQASWGEWKTKHNLPAAVAGYAYKSELLLGARPEKDEFVKTICHEATHAIVARYYPGRHLPLWLNEGVAEYCAARAIALKRGSKVEKFIASGTVDHELRAVFARTNYQDTPAPAAAPAATPVPVMAPPKPGEPLPIAMSEPRPPPVAIPINAMRNPDGERAELEKVLKFYRTSERCVMALNERVDSANFPKFLNLLAAGNPTDLALRAAYGKLCDSPEALAKLSDL